MPKWNVQRILSQRSTIYNISHSWAKIKSTEVKKQNMENKSSLVFFFFFVNLEKPEQDHGAQRVSQSFFFFLQMKPNLK